MAKLSGRPGSRQSQSSAQDAHVTRATRSTRSVSREPSEKAKTPKRGGRKAKATKDLPAVEEDNDAEEQLQAEIAADQAAADADEAARRASVAASAMSGTTVKTSFSQEEIGELDPEVMVAILPTLASAAEELAKLLVPADPKSRSVVRKEIRTAGSKHNKLFNIRVSAVGSNKTSFGSTEYIQPSIVLRALLGVQNMRDVPPGPWRPDPVIYKINLAQMLRSVLITVFDNTEVTVEGYNAMEALDVNFPSAITGPEFDPDAVRLCISMLTQLAIIRATVYMTDPTATAQDTITNTFYASDQEGDQLFRHRNVLHMLNLSKQESTRYTNAISQTVNQLLEPFQNADPIAALGALRAKYPWEQFVEHAVQYYLKRSTELNQQIAAQGGVDQIMVGLSDEVERRADARVAAEKRESFARPGGTPKKSFGKGGIRALKAREKQLAASTAPAAPVAQMTQATVVPPDNTAPPMDDGLNRLEDDDQIMQPSQAQSTARSTLQALSNLQNGQRQNAAKGKGRSFTDRQEGAQRVAWDDNELTQYNVPQGFQYPTSSAQQQGPYYQSPRAAKRTHQEVEDDGDDFDPTQDQGFEVDQRDTAAADQRRRNAPQPAPPPRPSQGRFSSINSGAPGPSTMGPPSQTGTPSKRIRRNPGSTIPAPPPPFDPDDVAEISREEQLRRVRIAARHSTIMASQQRPVQVRNPWTEEEEFALMDLIAEEGGEGVSYAKLKAHDEARGADQKLARRSAEDFRFKARNQKEQYLKARTALPANYEFIVLDKKAITKLHNLGIEYHQDRIRGGLAAEPIV